MQTPNTWSEETVVEAHAEAYTRNMLDDLFFNYPELHPLYVEADKLFLWTKRVVLRKMFKQVWTDAELLRQYQAVKTWIKDVLRQRVRQLSLPQVPEKNIKSSTKLLPLL